MAIADSWLDERGLSLLNTQARSALRCHCAFFSSEGEVIEILGDAYMSQVRFYVSISIYLYLYLYIWMTSRRGPRCDATAPSSLARAK